MNRIKQWILNREFIRALYRKAFDDASKDLKETQVYDVDKKAKELSEQRLTNMLSFVDYNNILSVDKRNGFLYLGKERASDLQLSNLKAEAEFLENSHIWKLLHETPKELAHQTMFVSSESLDDLKKGKSMLFLLDTQKKVLDILKLYTKK